METIARPPLETVSGTIQPYAEERARAGARPVFIVGCPRSGTTLLYHMILSSGDFAVFLRESSAFCFLGLKFPNLESVRERKGLLDYWLSTPWSAGSGLKRGDIEARILEECRNIGDFLRIVMEAICRKQGVSRWAEKSPLHALYIPEIKQFIPGALVVHIIRDGRDVALSLANFGRTRPFPWDGSNNVSAFGVYWKWMVRKARTSGRRLGQDYYEMHYEDLVQNPKDTLAALGRFIDHELDHDRILQTGIGSVSHPESSFKGATTPGDFKPVDRWRQKYLSEELGQFESLVGDCLEEFGYTLASDPSERRQSLSTVASRVFYTSQIESLHWLKGRKALRHFVGKRGKSRQ